jgi:hypothetical protein
MTSEALPSAGRTPNATRDVRVSSGLNVFLGTWIAVSPWILGNETVGTVGVWSNAIAGSLAALFAGIRIRSPGRRSGLSWINVCLGGLIGLSPWIFDYAADDLRMWNSVVAGALMAMLASWSASTTAVYRVYWDPTRNPR